MTHEASSAVPSRNKLSPAAGKSNGPSGAALHQYQVAVQLLQQGKYEKALAAFEKQLADAPAEIQERCRMYIASCRRQVEKPVLQFFTPEEQYDYAISLLNSGYYEDAREQFQGILAAWPDADFAFYGLAALDAMTSQAQGCLDNLARAIELNPRNRLQARVDNDFQNMVDDPRFTELLYPEIP